MPGKAKTAARKRSTRYWSREVSERSDALDREHGVSGRRRKGTPYQSAMSMLNFYLNRAGRRLPVLQKRVLERAKGELRKLFERS
jgi:hypothetical protein